MNATTYTGPIGVGSVFRRGDRVVRVVGDLDPRFGWPCEVVSAGPSELPVGGRRRISGDKLRTRYEPISGPTGFPLPEYQPRTKEAMHG